MEFLLTLVVILVLAPYALTALSFVVYGGLCLYVKFKDLN